MLNTRKLKARMVEMGFTQKDVADSLNLALSTLNQKLNGSRPFLLDEARKLADLLEIPREQFGEYFFV